MEKKKPTEPKHTFTDIFNHATNLWKRERERWTQQIDCLNKKVVYAFRDGREKVIVVDSDGVASVINFSMMDERPEILDKDSDPIRVIRQVKIKSKYKLSTSLQ